MSQVNRAKGEAAAIIEVARATAEGLRLVGDSLRSDGGKQAMELRIAEQYIPQLGRIAQRSSTVVLPANLTDLGGVLAMAKGIFRQEKERPEEQEGGASNGASSSGQGWS